MNRSEAFSLARHLNRRSGGHGDAARYFATAEPILTRRRSYWVLIRDAHGGASLPPIVHAAAYLERVRETGEMTPEGVAALEEWVRLQAAMAAEEIAETELVYSAGTRPDTCPGVGAVPDARSGKAER